MKDARVIPQICPSCGKTVGAKVFGSYEGAEPETPPYRYDAAVCPVCSEAMLFVDENYGYGWEGPQRLFPQPRTPLSHAIPQTLRNDLLEARKCLDARCFTAAAIMVRRMTDNLCIDRGASSGSLFTRLKTLKDQGVIEARLYEWADILREIGNEGAHGDDPVSKDDAHEALAMAEALVDYVYSFQERYNKFKGRINARKTSSSSTP